MIQTNIKHINQYVIMIKMKQFLLVSACCLVLYLPGNVNAAKQCARMG